MIRHALIASVLVAAASTAAAQTQLVRGDVDSVQSTNTFVLECTSIQLVSTTVNLRALHDASRQSDIEYEMQVRDVSTGGKTILDVVSAKQIPELMDMGNLRFGRDERWQVLGQAGQVAVVYLAHGSTTGYLPIGPQGTWLLTQPTFFHAGLIGGAGRFEFRFTMPTIPSLVGQLFVSQAVVAGQTGFLITNPDCKAVRAD